MTRLRLFHRIMLRASILSWVLVSLMPVINAHGSNAGVWATLCTINGFELVKVSDGKPQTQHGKPCPFAHFSNFHADKLPTTRPNTTQSSVISDSYTFLALSVRFERQVPRGPPEPIIA
ncbi:hypothetical protein M0358_002351 [Vibrio fluvialis]|uniref:hypothetical protein n=2 Tax=Vibrio fluvialis TaxID=676 RepID=UPI00192C066C|nr:hypothetical protein [Vibrio fluvialis]EKO3425320.1 hypothetical protein [Vibrio fluvialis]EKO3435629.1 hypothetical protein [Vibrio fluvialis]EKO3442768.1 hypothetical protein [Vibrio fluvialis]EKO3475967.1 hypothetical protein [Vibrio fluvialis]EKO3482249.1 hypothetical protein [Vibrio fluvialis]